MKEHLKSSINYIIKPYKDLNNHSVTIVNMDNKHEYTISDDLVVVAVQRIRRHRVAKNNGYEEQRLCV